MIHSIMNTKTLLQLRLNQCRQYLTVSNVCGQLTVTEFFMFSRSVGRPRHFPALCKRTSSEKSKTKINNFYVDDYSPRFLNESL